MSTCNGTYAKGLLLATLLWPRAGSAEPEKARPADSFVDGIGVNTHFLFSNYIDNFDSAIVPRLREMGIRHIRDGILLDDEPFKDRIRAVGAFGVKGTFITRPTQFPGVVAWAKDMATYVATLEGPNEPHNEPTSTVYKGLMGMAALKPYQMDLYAAVRAEPALANVQVASPGIDWFPAYKSVGDLDAWCDLGNFHHWPPSTGETAYIGSAPTDGLYRGPGGNADTGLLKAARTIASTKPLIATETGWSTTTIKPTADHGWDPGVSDRAAARYATRVALELFNNGVKRYFLYELIDDYLIGVPVKQHMGLISQDGALKTHGVAVKNVISLLADPGADFAPASLDYALSATGVSLVDDKNFRTGEIHHTLLQKRDGTFYLVLWNESISYDNATEKDIDIPEQTVTLKLTTPIRQAKTFLPLAGTAAVATFDNPTEIALKVSDQPLVVALTPPGGANSPADAGVVGPSTNADAAGGGTGGAGGSSNVVNGSEGSSVTMMPSSGGGTDDTSPGAAPKATSSVGDNEPGCACRLTQRESTTHRYAAWLVSALAVLASSRRRRATPSPVEPADRA